jgi:hypothetical protein
MASLGKTPKQIKLVLNKFLSRRKSPKLKVICISIISQRKLFFF